MEKTAEDALQEEQDAQEDASGMIRRPPVVTVMGHVDHGKTSLLDAIRQTAVTEQEAGGITQHIGAYTVEVSGRQITFLDTPGHEAFTSMRMRGGQAADIVILVVAADDGIMPQTIEAISHAKAAEVAIVVAINKMDVPAANPDRIKQELTEYGLVAEEWGGETIIVPVSAKTKEGLDQLLEMVWLTADMRELTANPNRQARGVIVEAQLDRGRGPVATVLVQNGTLRIGDTMNAAQDDRLSRLVAEERRDKLKVQQLKTMSKASLDDLFSQMQAGEVKDLNLVIKADVQGSVEAVRQAMEKLSNDEVRVRCVHGGVGAITSSDVMLASVANAIIIGFNVRPDNTARESAEREGVDVRLYRIIYQATEEIQAAMKGLLAPQVKETVLGSAQVRQVFRVTGVGTIAGSYVTSGDIRRNAQARLIRDGVVVYESKVDSLKRFKDDAREVHQGYECGIGLENYNDIKEGDVIECYMMEEIAR
jgi:translation initiation factor IF-2